MLDGLPDLSAPLPDLPGVAYQAFGRNGLVVAVPTRLGLETQSDGKPALRMTLLRKVGDGTSTGGRLEIGFSVDADLARLGQALVERKIPARVALAEIEDGILTIAARLGPLEPQPLIPPTALDAALLTRARIVLDLGAAQAVLAASLVEDAALPVEARLRLRFRGVAPRLPLALAFDPRALARRLAERVGGKEAASRAVIEAALDALRDAPEVTVEVGGGAASDAEARRGALFMRLQDILFEASDTGDLFRLAAPENLPAGRIRIDLAAPAAVWTDRSLAMDPLAVARTLNADTLDGLVRRIEPPPLQMGNIRVRASANLPDDIAGLEALFADVRAPAAPPLRLQPLSASIRLDAPDRRGETPLRLAPGEVFGGEMRLRAVLSQGDTVAELAGDWRQTQRIETLLGPGDFPTPFTVIRASRALRAEAEIEILLPDGTTIGRVEGDSLAVPRTTPSLRVCLTPGAGGATLEIPIGSERRLDLDLATLPDFGVHRALVRADIPAGAPPILVEWRNEAEPPDEAPLGVTLSAERPEAEIGWLAASPFRPGVYWRIVRRDTAAPWSGPIAPREALVIDVSKAVS
jgi:hypothetical protein